MLTLVDVYSSVETFTASLLVLWELLKEREPHQSISHKAMPTRTEHMHFAGSRPYAAWYLIFDGGRPVGACYLSKQREIGISIFRTWRGKGYAKQAITELLRLHPGRALANIAPGNEASIALFRGLGFEGPIQITLEKEA